MGSLVLEIIMVYCNWENLDLGKDTDGRHGSSMTHPSSFQNGLPDFTRCRHNFALRVLLLENAPRHGAVGGLDDSALSDRIGGRFEDIGDFE